MKMRLAIAASAAVLAVLVALPAQAQRSFGEARGFGGSRGISGGAGGIRGGNHMHGPFRGGRGRFVRPRYGGRGRYYNRSGFIAAPYFYPPDFYADYYYAGPPAAEPPPPQVVIVKTSEPAVQTPPAPPVEPLVLELHGDHWVRITDSGETEIGLANTQPGSAQASGRRSAGTEAAQQVRPLPPAVLVFRDGHQEQTKKYTIIGPVIYTSASYSVGGAWTKKIPLAALDVPATLQINRERGVTFNLPSAPNEVVIRP
jgi:hypothetical protein